MWHSQLSLLKTNYKRIVSIISPQPKLRYLWNFENRVIKYSWSTNYIFIPEWYDHLETVLYLKIKFLIHLEQVQVHQFEEQKHYVPELWYKWGTNKETSKELRIPQKPKTLSGIFNYIFLSLPLASNIANLLLGTLIFRLLLFSIFFFCHKCIQHSLVSDWLVHVYCSQFVLTNESRAWFVRANPIEVPWIWKKKRKRRKMWSFATGGPVRAGGKKKKKLFLKFGTSCIVFLSPLHVIYIKISSHDIIPFF